MSNTQIAASLNGAFEIHASKFMKGQFFIYNAKTEDLLRSRDNSTIYYDTVDEAIARANGEAKVNLKSEKKERAPRVKGESALGLMKQLISEGILSDEEILARVQEKASGYKHVSIVKYTRNKMAEKAAK